MDVGRDFWVITIFVLIATIVPVFILYLKFRWGLATRIYAIVIPLIGFAVVSTICLITCGVTLTGLLVGIPLVSIFTYTALYCLYRTVVKRLAFHIQERK